MDQQILRNASIRLSGRGIHLLLALTAAACLPGPARGDLDEGFGGSQTGTVVRNFEDPSRPAADRDGDDRLQFIGQDRRGRLLVVGTAAYVSSCRGQLVVARYFAHGMPDNAYGAPNDNAVRVFFAPTTNSYGVDAVDAAIDGETVVVLARALFQWECACNLVPCDPDQSVRETYHIVRFTEQGNVDGGFGSQGWSHLQFAAADLPASAQPAPGQPEPDVATVGKAVAVLPDGNVMVGADVYAAGQVYMGLARFTSSGQPDLSFHGNGRWIADFGGNAAVLWDLAAQRNGKTVAAGTLASPTSVALIRMLADGSEDPSFDGDGRATLATSHGGARLIAFDSVPGQDDDRIVVASQTALFRFNADGGQDTSFGVNGVTVRPASLWPGGLGIDRDDTIFVSGTDTTTTGNGVFLEAYSPAGQPNLTFAGGRLVTDFLANRDAFTPGGTNQWGLDYWGLGLLVQSNQFRVIVAGTTEVDALRKNDFAMKAYLTAAPLARSVRTP